MKRDSEEVCTHPKKDRGKIDGRRNMANRLFDGHGDIVDRDQADGCRHSMFG